MKDELLQIKQDIIDISNDLKTNLADKGITADGTLSELVDSVLNIDSNVLAEIGWNLVEQPFLKDAINYAKEILKNPKSSYTGNKLLIIFPKVEELKFKAYMFDGSNLSLFPDGVKLTGDISYGFRKSPILKLDLTNYYGEGTMSYAFLDCFALKELAVNELFGRNSTLFTSIFLRCNSLKKIDYLDVSSATSTLNLFDGCVSIEYINIIGDASKITTNTATFKDCSNLKYLSVPENFPLTGSTYEYGHLQGIQVPKIYGSFDYTNAKCYGNSYYYWVTGFGQNKYTRYLLIKNIGSYQAGTYLNMEYNWVWGIANDEVPDARLSLIDSLITYSFDRAAAGYSTQTWKLYKDVKALLTDDEIAQITAKGYTLV